MNYELYLDKFRKSAGLLDRKKLYEKQLELNVGVTLNSVVLKLYKKEWANDKVDPLKAKTRIFFAIWVNDKTLKVSKIFYNIHALKLRLLHGYSITSRDFADNFRNDFKKHQHDWKNVSLDFGPLTLMEGWEYFDMESLNDIIERLANNFVEIDYLIDDTLDKFKLITNS
jgi:hypothetical protein